MVEALISYIIMRYTRFDDVKEVLTDPKFGGGVGLGSVFIGSIFSYIPADIGRLASLLGALLSLVLIVIHVRKEIRASRQDRTPET